MQVDRFDHIVLTVRSTEAAVSFYETALGMTRVETGAGRVALHFGNQKINLHETGSEFAPHAMRPTPGSADLCFVTSSTPEEIRDHLASRGIVTELGPVERNGAIGPMKSFYFRDPDGNLVELATYDRQAGDSAATTSSSVFQNRG